MLTIAKAYRADTLKGPGENTAGSEECAQALEKALECCAQALEKALECCAHLGVPVAPLKMHGPTTKLVFLGIEIDTEARRVRLPEAKLHRLQTEIKKWQGR